MFKDLFDRLHLFAVVLTIFVIALLVSGFLGSDSSLSGQERNASIERAMLEKARAAFLLEVYTPVESLVTAGNYAAALLKLQELEKSYPGEPHTAIWRGSILVTQGVMGEGLSRYAYAVKTNGDYVDANSSLNRRQEIGQLVASALPQLKSSLRQTANPTLERALHDAYYLQSRLAGGCE